MTVARLFKVTIQFDYQKRDEVSTWHCGSLEGARNFCKEKIDKGGVIWYSIEGQDFIPCDKNDPNGLLYIGIIYNEFHEL